MEKSCGRPPLRWRCTRKAGHSGPCAALQYTKYKCVQCGCFWRDNLDGTMSLFNGTQKSCGVCEFLPLSDLTPVE